MKRTLFFIVFFTAVRSKAQFTFGVLGGCSITAFTDSRFSKVPVSVTTAFNSSYKTSYISNYKTGIIADFIADKKTIFQFGLLLNSKGSRLNLKATYTYDSTWETVRVLYLQLPINLIHQWVLSKKCFVGFGGGLYGAYGISGTESGEGIDYTTNSTYYIADRIKFRNRDMTQLFPVVIRPFDLGYNLVGEISYLNFALLLNYSHGFTNIYPGSNPYGLNSKNIVINLSLAYFLR